VECQAPDVARIQMVQVAESHSGLDTITCGALATQSSALAGEEVLNAAEGRHTRLALDPLEARNAALVRRRGKCLTVCLEVSALPTDALALLFDLLRKLSLPILRVYEDHKNGFGRVYPGSREQ
jgi:hypothetical protein